MTSVGTHLYQAPEVTKAERYCFKADVFSFALTMYAICDRVRSGCGLSDSSLVICNDRFLTSLSSIPQKQDSPFTRSERERKFRLANDVAKRGYRPPLRQSWNPEISCLITLCWCGDPALRPSMHQVVSFFSNIMNGGVGHITMSTAPKSGAGTQADKTGKKGAGSLNFAPGELWRSMEVSAKSILRGDILGHGS